MTYQRQVISILLLTLLPLAATAQSNGTNSSYSRYGLGLLCDQSQGYNRSMGGVGQALRSGNRLNKLNPASYSAIDSLSFLFDVGMSLQRTRMKQGGSHQTANNTSFDYVIAGWRLRRNLGMSVGFVPYSDIGYNFSKEEDITVDPISLQRISQELTYTGSGGLHEIFLGMGWQPFKGFSAGFNAGYRWGSINHAASQTFLEDGTVNTTSYSSLTTAYVSDVRTWSAEVGLQYRTVVNPTNRLTLGATVGIGHSIYSKATMMRASLSADTISSSIHNAFQLPMTYSFGAAWEWTERLLVAADVTMQQWGNCTTPQLVTTATGGIDYVANTGVYKNRWLINAGAEFVPGRYDNSYLRRVNYRFGASYSTPYLKINGLEGPREFSLTAGMGFPVFNVNSRSYVNFGVQWVHRKPSSASLITENVMLINIGLTFHEAWFMKWKFR